MNFKQKPIFRILTNPYFIILIVFFIWVLFLDENSYLIHKELNTEINELENTIQFLEKRIYEDQGTIKMLQDSLSLERYAREKYLMKKENEDVYIIKFDTIKKQ